MNKKEVAELKRRLKKEECTFTRVCGCYVDAEHNKVTKLGDTFLNLEEEEYFKYLEIAKKVLSGKVGNNILTLKMNDAELQQKGKQQFFMGLRDSKLKNEELLDVFYDMVIDTYDYVGNYLILIFHDAYDVMTRTSDNSKLDESEEVYEYLLCAICPVALSKPGLGYREDENRIGTRIRDWVVGMPDTGFVFPAFNNRSTDTGELMFYTKNVKVPHTEFMSAGLGCEEKRTATEQQLVFNTSIVDAMGGESDEADAMLYEVQNALSVILEDKENTSEETVLSTERVERLLQDAGIEDYTAKSITKALENELGEEKPVAENLFDEKLLETGKEKKEKLDLEKEVEVLRGQLGIEPEMNTNVKTYDVILRLKPEKEAQVQVENRDGKKYIVIPMDENECATVNGVDKLV